MFLFMKSSQLIQYYLAGFLVTKKEGNKFVEKIDTKHPYILTLSIKQNELKFILIQVYFSVRYQENRERE